MISTIPLKQAFLSLSRAMDRASREPDDLEVRDACIQRFEYTDLPMRVDIVDWASITPEFRTIIKAAFVDIQ